MVQNILGNTPEVEALRKAILRVAPHESRVLILGENGSGKELVAAAIHRHSSRKDKPFVALNCAAVPEGLLESQIFGSEKGAYTGSTEMRQGVFERADGGTLFLDEIGDMPLTMQAKLLRVLQDGSFERLGGKHTFKVNVRVIAATNKNLQEEVRQGRFREDLYFRISGILVRTPSLRERIQDVPLLVKEFLSRSTRPTLTLLEAGARALTAHSWPGNVRELINVVDRLVVMTDGNEIGSDDVSDVLGTDFKPRGHSLTDDLQEMEHRIVERVVEQVTFNLITALAPVLTSIERPQVIVENGKKSEPWTWPTDDQHKYDVNVRYLCLELLEQGKTIKEVTELVFGPGADPRYLYNVVRYLRRDGHLDGWTVTEKGMEKLLELLDSSSEQREPHQDDRSRAERTQPQDHEKCTSQVSHDVKGPQREQTYRAQPSL